MAFPARSALEPAEGAAPAAEADELADHDVVRLIKTGVAVGTPVVLIRHQRQRPAGRPAAEPSPPAAETTEEPPPAVDQRAHRDTRVGAVGSRSGGAR